MTIRYQSQAKNDEIIYNTFVSFSKRVILVRNAYGVNQKQIAGAGDTSSQNVSKWEKGTFEPRLEVKKMIADALSLSTNWFITGVGFPFLDSKVIILKPSGKHFEEALTLLTLASNESTATKILMWNLRQGTVYFSILFEHRDAKDSAVLVKTPLGYEKLFLKLTEKHRNTVYLGKKSDLDDESEELILTSFDFLTENYKEFGSADARTIIPKGYFFIELYNLDRENLMKFIYSKVETMNERINKAFFEKYVPDFINVFAHHHAEFKKIVRNWIKGEGFSEKQRMIMKDFTKESKFSDLFESPITFLWERYLIDGIKKNRLQPFSFAYRELMSLIFAEGQKISVIRPELDEETDKLFWPDESKSSA